MNKVRIIVGNFEDVTDCSFGALWSDIYVTVDGWCFPSSDWSDATSSVLIMWLGNLLSIISLPASNSVLLYFMDGDFRIKITPINNCVATAEFIGPYEKVLLVTEIDLIYFGRQLLSAAAKMICFYKEHTGLREIRELIEFSNKLRKAIRKNKGENIE